MYYVDYAYHVAYYAYRYALCANDYTYYVFLSSFLLWPLNNNVFNIAMY